MALGRLYRIWGGAGGVGGYRVYVEMGVIYGVEGGGLYGAGEGVKWSIRPWGRC